MGRQALKIGHRATTGSARGSAVPDETIAAAPGARRAPGVGREPLGRWVSSGWREQPGALCRDLPGAVLHSLSNQAWMCLCWFWWKSPRKDRTWVASPLRNPQADVEAEINQQTLRSHLELVKDAGEQPCPCSPEAWCGGKSIPSPGGGMFTGGNYHCAR